MVSQDQTCKKDIKFPYPGAPNGEMSIRTIILGDNDFDSDQIKPTLVMIHGFGGAGVTMYPLFRPLLEHFRLVLIDQIGFGGSSRIKKLPDSCFESVEAMDKYQVGWLLKWLE